jgi:hypothetical protein
MEKRKSQEFLVINGILKANDTTLSKRINTAAVVFHNNKLIKNTGGTIFDRVGTLFAQSEIVKAQKGYRVSCIELSVLK